MYNVALWNLQARVEVQAWITFAPTHHFIRETSTTSDHIVSCKVCLRLSLVASWSPRGGHHHNRVTPTTRYTTDNFSFESLFLSPHETVQARCRMRTVSYLEKRVLFSLSRYPVLCAADGKWKILILLLFYGINSDFPTLACRSEWCMQLNHKFYELLCFS